MKDASACPRLLLDLAYGCFAIIALFSCVFVVLSILPSANTEAEAAYSELIAYLGIFVILIAGLVGLVLSVLHWREWPLQVMSVAFVVAVITILFEENNIVSTAVWLGATLVCIVFPVRWFRSARRSERAELNASRN